MGWRVGRYDRPFRCPVVRPFRCPEMEHELYYRRGSTEAARRRPRPRRRSNPVPRRRAGRATTAAICEDAGLPSGLLYHRFGFRQALLAELWLVPSGDSKAVCSTPSPPAVRSSLRPPDPFRWMARGQTPGAQGFGRCIGYHLVQCRCRGLGPPPAGPGAGRPRLALCHGRGDLGPDDRCVDRPVCSRGRGGGATDPARRGRAPGPGRAGPVDDVGHDGGHGGTITWWVAMARVAPGFLRGGPGGSAGSPVPPAVAPGW